MNRCHIHIDILFADDETEARHSYTAYLETHFHTVHEASDGEEAWQQYLQHKPRIVLLDILMPKMDGLEVARKIRRQDKDTRIILLTAYLSEARLLEAVELGLTRLLPKPFGRQELNDALNKATSELEQKNILSLPEDHDWNQCTCQLFCRHRHIKLTPNESKLMQLLASGPGQVFSKDALEFHLWPELLEASEATARLKALIKRLRSKLPPNTIENLYGEGYRLNIYER